MLSVHEATTAEQKEAIYRHRYQILAAELGKHQDIADHDRGELRDPLDEFATHLYIADKHSTMLGSIRMGCGRRHATPDMWRNYRLDRFAEYADTALSFTGRLVVLPEHRGNGATVRLVQAIYQHGRSRGVQFDFIFCDPHLVSLYEHLGHRRYCSYYIHPGLGFQVPMVLVPDDVEHLRKVGSPFLPVAEHWPAGSANVTWLRDTFPEVDRFLSSAILGHQAFVDRLTSRPTVTEHRLLQGLSASDLAEFLRGCVHLQIPTGVQLCRQSKMRELYLVIEGELEVRRTGAAECTQEVLRLGPGDFFGEHGGLLGEARELDVRALCLVEVILVESVILQRLMRSHPALSARLMFNLARALLLREQQSGLVLEGAGAQ